MNIISLVTGPFEVNCLLIPTPENSAIVIDPGYSASKINQALEKHGLSVAAYVCTHGHTDHINALAQLHRERPAPVMMHSMDWQWAFDEINQLVPYYTPPEKPDVDVLPLECQKTWTFDGLSFDVIETPGHTPGSVCLYFPESANLISGDTLFKGSCGRTDLTGGDPRKLKTSLNKLKMLPDNVTVYPGHGSSTQIGIEKKTNYFMQ